MTAADRAALLESVVPWLVLLSKRRTEGTRVPWQVLFQEVALRVVKYAHDYDPARSTPATWATIVFRSTAGLLFARLARRVRTVRLASAGSDDADPDRQAFLADPRPGPDTLVIQREAVAAVRAAVARLPEPDRVVVTRVFGLDGRPPSAVARVARQLGLERYTAAAALDRGLAAVRAALEPREGSG